MSNNSHIVIVGGGTAGITVAATLLHKSRKDEVNITLIDPADTHYYQPGFTLVGGGSANLDSFMKPMEKVVPKQVEWRQKSVTAYHPEHNKVELNDGSGINYDYLVVCPGLELNWDKIAGVKQNLGRHGICSNYSPDSVVDTWDDIQALKPGDTAIFTQPAMPIKCPGAPQKAVYLAADYLKKKGILGQCKIHFMTHTPAIFSVPFFAKELVKVANRYGINVHYQTNLVAVDVANRKAVFEVVGGEKQGKKFTSKYDMIHVTPPQSPPESVRTSELANEAGYVDVKQDTLQHTKYNNIYSLGDACSTPNSKTAAAVRKQAPVVVDQILTSIRGEQGTSAYDGYASCPITTAYNKVLMAEFCYGGKVTPTFPLDPRKERLLNWLIKKYGLPLFYWYYMLKGFDKFFPHNTNYLEPTD